jgi:hypothetical protein
MNEHTYHVDRSTSRRRRQLVRTLWLLAVIAVVAGGLWLQGAMKPDTVIGDAKPTTTHIGLLPTQNFQLRTFQINLPEDWKQVTPAVEHATYSWRGATAENNARALDIYVDATPSNFAVNRVVSLVANGAGVQAIGSISNNCSTFTLAGATDPQTGIAPSKWNGIDFLCDMANYIRNVVGTSSAEGINTVNVAGPSGTHKYFFVYTDHSGEPNFDTFTQALQSFEAL